MVQGGGNDDDGDDGAVEKVAATRMRVLQMIHPDWNVKKQQVGSFSLEGDLMGFSLSGNLERSWFGHRDWSGELRKETWITWPIKKMDHDLNHLLEDNGEHADAVGVPRLHALPGRHGGVRRLHQL